MGDEVLANGYNIETKTQLCQWKHSEHRKKYDIFGLMWNFWLLCYLI